MLERMFDAAFPPDEPVAGCAAAAGYLGGDTPHVWTGAEWNAATARGRLRMLPIWVSAGILVNPRAQARDAAAAAVALGWQPHHQVRRVIGLDMETEIDPQFVAAFGGTLHELGFGCWPYGSESTIFGNPAIDGYWVAAYPGPGPVVTFPGEHVVAHQYAADVHTLGGLVDMSVITKAALEHLGRGPRKET